MKRFFNSYFSLVLLIVALMPMNGNAQSKTKKERKHEIYGSWGYNSEWYTHSNISVKQAALGNDYKFVAIHAHDHPGWDDGLFTKALSIPQYNYRLGMFLNRDKGWAVEINFDHTKYLIRDNQMTRIKGTFNGHYVDSTVLFANNGSAHSSYYYLNNGANFLLFNIVKRWHLLGKSTPNFKLDGLLKGGIGPVIPHVEDKLFGNANDPHFQFGGWNIGTEGALRATFYKYVYLEYTNKFDYARYSNLKIYEGTAKQAFGTYEMILNLGFTYPVGKIIK